MEREDNILKLEEVFGVMSHTKTFELLSHLIDAKNTMDYLTKITKLKMSTDILEGNDIQEGIDILKDIDFEMVMIDANIKVLGDAMLCYETKIFEKRTFANLPFIVGLN
jgi:hypothetical protein